MSAPTTLLVGGAPPFAAAGFVAGPFAVGGAGGSPVIGPLPSGSDLTHGLVSGLLSSFQSWVLSGTASLITELGKVLTSTTTPGFGASFTKELDALGHLGAFLALPFLVLAAIQAIIRQDLSLLLRAAFLRLPAAVLLTGTATELVSLALGATDEACAALVRAGPSPTVLVANLARLLGGSGPEGAVMSGFAGVVIAMVASAVALLLWLELAVRSAAVSVATLFLPLALAGLVWSATAHWARRLAETIAALVMAKLVIVGVLVLAAGTLVGSKGAPGLVEGLALLLLAAGAPFTLLRLLPMIESGAVGHLEGVGRRGGRLVAMAGGMAKDGAQWAAGAGSGDGGSDPVPFETGRMGLYHPVVVAEAAREARERLVSPEGAEAGGGTAALGSADAS